MKPTYWIIIVLVTGSMVSGCGMMFAEIEEPHFCQTSTVQVSGVSPGVNNTTILAEVDLPSELHSLKDLGFSSRFDLSVVLDGGQSGSHFDFVNSAAVQIDGEDLSCPNDELAAFQRDSAHSDEPTLTIASAKTFDLVRCVGSQSLTVRTTLTGNLPRTPWSVDVKVCLAGKARIDVSSN
jgi:hypothetical protein